MGHLALILVRRGAAAEGLALADEALALVDARHFGGRVNVARLARARGLRALGRMEEARTALADAQASVMNFAAAIEKPEWRRSFLQDEPVNRATLAEVARSGLPDTD
jgi:hypothetical protein